MANALIIGAGGAIGSAIARRLTEAGVRVIGTARKVDASAPGEWREADLTEPESVSAMIADLPPLDLVVFAQGMRPAKSLADSDLEHCTNMFLTHVICTITTMRHLLPRLAPEADVVLIGSSAARKGSYDPSYAAAKGAIASLTVSWAKELKHRIRVNCIAPGLVEDSPVHKSMPPAHAEKHSSQMFGGRLIAGDDIASMVLEMHRNKSMTGSVVGIDGGFAE